jgi:hypothetical protein
MAMRGTLAVLLMAALLGAPPLASSDGGGVEVAAEPEAGSLDALIDPPTRETIVLVLAGVAFASIVGAVILLVAGGLRASRKGEPVESAFERRTLRRARMRLGEDPIVTAIEVRAEADRLGRRRRRPSAARPDGRGVEAHSGRT